MFRPTLAIVLALTATPLVAETDVTVLRVPDGGIQPQAMKDPFGTVHLVYFKGAPAAGDMFYASSVADGQTWSKPMRVNSQPNSAIATGTIRGAHLALGDRVFVAWNGSATATPRGPDGASPMLVARMNDVGTAFEPQRNVITSAWGLDGGGSVAARGRDVYVAWHAPTAKGAGEASRRVMVARSTDAGETWLPERPAWDEPTGACGCCGLRAFADASGGVSILYRSATEMVHRDIYLLRSTDKGETFTGARLSKVNVSKCVMSSASFAGWDGDVVAAWETNGQVVWGRVGSDGRISPPGEGNNRKHPAIAVNERREVLLAWSEDTGWNKGGSVAWQVFGADGAPVAGQSGKVGGLPAWGMPAVFWRRDGGFVVLY